MYGQQVFTSLLREIDTVTLIIAISGTSSKIQEKILKNISKNLSVTIIDEMGTIRISIISKIVNSQKKVIGTMHYLRNQSNIVI